jgi:hypothetical protein
VVAHGDVAEPSANDVLDIAEARANSLSRQGFPGSACMTSNAECSRSSVSTRSQPGASSVDWTM